MICLIRSTTIALAVLVITATASAAPKIALPAIEGDTTGAMRDAVAAALDGDELTVIGEREVNRAYDRLSLENLAEMTEKQAKKMSSDLEADAVVTAVLGRKGRFKTLKFRLFLKGKKQRGFTVQFKNAKSKKFKTALRNKVVDRLSEEKPPEPAVVKRDEEDDAPIKKRKVVKRDLGDDEGEGDDEPRSKSKSKSRSKADADDENDDDDEITSRGRGKKKRSASRDDDDFEEETAIEKRIDAKHTANRVAARIDAGVSFGNRSLVFTNRPNFPEGPKPFRSSPVPGARVEGELYPFAFLNPSNILAGVGGAFEYDKTLVLNLGTTAEPGAKVPVNQQAYSFGGRFRYAFGKRATSPTITVGVDIGRRRWKADRSKLMDRMSLNGLGALDLPDTNYAFTAPGLGFRVPLARFLAIVGYGKGLFVSKAGPIQKAEMYGKAKILGFQAEGGFDVVINNRFAFRAMFEITQFGYTFVGDGGFLANSRDGDPASRDMGGAQDRSLGGVATLAVLY